MPPDFVLLPVPDMVSLGVLLVPPLLPAALPPVPEAPLPVAEPLVPEVPLPAAEPLVPEAASDFLAFFCFLAFFFFCVPFVALVSP